MAGRSGKWLRGLPLLALVAIGLWLWNSTWFVKSRELNWQVGKDRSAIREVEIQIWTTQGELLKRGVFFFTHGAPSEITQEVPLKQGVYQARVFVSREGEPSKEQYSHTLEIGAQGHQVLSLRRSD
jgi:hypothetical protein